MPCERIEDRSPAVTEMVERFCDEAVNTFRVKLLGLNDTRPLALVYKMVAPVIDEMNDSELADFVRRLIEQVEARLD